MQLIHIIFNLEYQILSFISLVKAKSIKKYLIVMYFLIYMIKSCLYKKKLNIKR